MSKLDQLLTPEKRNEGITLKKFSVEFGIALTKLQTAVREQEALSLWVIQHDVVPSYIRTGEQYKQGWIVDTVIAKGILTAQKVEKVLSAVGGVAEHELKEVA